MDKLLLEGEPSSPAVNAVHCAVEQASQVAQPALALAALQPMMMASAQRLPAIAHQQPYAAATNSPTLAAEAFGEMLCTVNKDISIIKILEDHATVPFPDLQQQRLLTLNAGPHQRAQQSPS
uniref:Uncharacterized protein n=1 Tax=Romanomermis culicivorax TaxID=13658 RepID=A0A915IQ07_ROMCU